MVMTWTNGIRLAFGLLTLSAVVTEIAVLNERGVFNAANFFSFFTILSNVAAGVFLILYSRSNKRAAKSKLIQNFRGAITLYMIMTGVIFAILLSGLENISLTATPWDNIVLHYIIPLVFAIDWIIYPSPIRLSMKIMLYWAFVPLLYVGYSLARGAAVGWYPYPFLNPDTSSYSDVLITSAFLFVGVIAASYALIAYSNFRRKAHASRGET